MQIVMFSCHNWYSGKLSSVKYLRFVYLKEKKLLFFYVSNTNSVSKVVTIAVYSICVQPLLFSDNFEVPM